MKGKISNPLWRCPPRNVELAANAVHVWRVDLAAQSENFEKLWVTLATDEQARANRFRFEQHRQNFVGARGTLRQILSQYLELEPSQIQFAYSDRGKPYLDHPLAQSLGIQFNLSHSHNFAAYAISRNRELGLDIEYIDPNKDIDSVSDRFFLATEATTLRSLPLEVKQQRFFACWTCKEAYAKAIGTGLSGTLKGGLNQIDTTSILQGSSDRLWHPPWLVTMLELHPKYAAALVVKGDDWHLHFCQFT